MSDFETQLDKMQSETGFIAALDQSGGSTPKALRLYGVSDEDWSGEEEMFDRVHEMRTRIFTSPAFNGERLIGTILFENTMDRQVEGKPSAEYIWREKNVVPFLKIDQGMKDEEHGVRMMKEIQGLDDLLQRAKQHPIFGTKERSVVLQANKLGIEQVVAQQFEVARKVMEYGLVPIMEPEVDINSPAKAEAEQMLHEQIVTYLGHLEQDQLVMLKITLPETDNLYADVLEHPNVVRVVALSGGYSREEANERLKNQNGVVASFSRALIQGLQADQSDEEFNQVIDRSIQNIYEASNT